MRAWGWMGKGGEGRGGREEEGRGEDGRTSPRRTWVMPISKSSTTDARWYVGKRSDLSRTGSVGRDACASRRCPNIRSGGVVRRGRFES